MDNQVLVGRFGLSQTRNPHITKFYLALNTVVHLGRHIGVAGEEKEFMHPPKFFNRTRKEGNFKYNDSKCRFQIKACQKTEGQKSKKKIFSALVICF